jgi:hypothetical protein
MTWRIEAGHDAHQAGLASLGSTQQDGHGAAARLQIHVIKPSLATDFFADTQKRQIHLATFTDEMSFVLNFFFNYSNYCSF